MRPVFIVTQNVKEFVATMKQVETRIALSADSREPIAVTETTERPALHHERMENTSLRELVSEIGLIDFQEDEYDIPTFLRKQAD